MGNKGIWLLLLLFNGIEHILWSQKIGNKAMSAYLSANLPKYNIIDFYFLSHCIIGYVSYSMKQNIILSFCPGIGFSFDITIIRVKHISDSTYEYNLNNTFKQHNRQNLHDVKAFTSVYLSLLVGSIFRVI